ncbi:MAG: SoxR reducing system RseC family protein [Rectinema sp.]|jgi:positive regulator of sigma E activity|uniref:Putative Positive regulator of sigma E, RseC/MucC n=1 Tax=uncultured spirochete TaxID=156406 RepID=A0A3P3XRV8_9SPIR|nr:putative Positive regulator of sigma E, RseC/MucC [uncultured spirochete]
MKEVATVKEIKGDMVTVAIQMQEGCGVCGNNGACKIRRSNLLVYNKSRIDVKEGEEVVIEVPGIEQAKSAFWVLGLPLIMLFVGYGFGALVFHAATEGPSVASAGIGFVVALLVGMLVQRRNRLESFPYILAKEGEGVY